MHAWAKETSRRVNNMLVLGRVKGVPNDVNIFKQVPILISELKMVIIFPLGRSNLEGPTRPQSAKKIRFVLKV